jgi:intermediate cleaving peptidase 55
VQRHKIDPVSFLDLNVLASGLLLKEMVSLGFPANRETIETVFPHSIGHHLGLDLHDCATIEITRPLTRDMCITIEPGIYIPHSPLFPERFHGIGIRIEDDLLLTDEGVSVLTLSVPKSIDELEAL